MEQEICPPLPRINELFYDSLNFMKINPKFIEVTANDLVPNENVILFRKGGSGLRCVKFIDVTMNNITFYDLSDPFYGIDGIRSKHTINMDRVTLRFFKRNPARDAYTETIENKERIHIATDIKPIESVFNYPNLKTNIGDFLGPKKGVSKKGGRKRTKRTKRKNKRKTRKHKLGSKKH